MNALIKVKLHPEVEKFLTENSSMLDLQDERWFCMPFWLKRRNDSWYMIDFEHLPDYVKDRVHQLHGSKPDQK